MGNDTSPIWYDGKQINEMLFCQEFLERQPMQYIGKSLFTVDGRISDENRLKKEILNCIEPYLKTGIAKKAANLLDALKLKCYAQPPDLQLDRIHVANGTYFLDGTFSEEKQFCLNRLPVAYVPDAPVPDRWLTFLNELLCPEDIPTLQEFIGYCLLPTTKAQKMLFLIGKGGEGKSRVGLILRKLFGDNMRNGSISKVETSPFARADLEHILVMVDDDLKLEALPQTNNIKTIVTAEMPLDLERKGQQSYQGSVYSRFIAFGNGTMKSLYDRSEGFFRRQLILTVRDRPKERVDDPFLIEKLHAEIEGILCWAIMGLKRLMDHQFRFTISQRTQNNMATAVKEGNNVVDFLESEGYFRFKADGEITSTDFYRIYTTWCYDNGLPVLSQKSFSGFLIHHEADYNLEYHAKVQSAGGRTVRGFFGVEAIA